MGLRQNGDYVVSGFCETPLLPAFAALLLAIGLLIAAWRREGGEAREPAVENSLNSEFRFPRGGRNGHTDRERRLATR